MRRTTRAVAMTALAVLALSGCTSGAKDGSSVDDKPSGDITYAFWDENQRGAIEDMVAAFNKEYPDVHVTLSVLPWSQYWTTLQTEASSDSLPDVFWMNMPNFELYASNGQLASIDDSVDSGAIDIDAYPSTLADFYKYDGVRYAVPKDADTTAVWINKALFAEAGVALPTADWTWDEYRKTAAELTAALKSQGVYGSGYYPYGQSMYYNTVYQAGGYIISPDGKSSGWDTPEAEQVCNSGWI